jgi:murein L,D-transpeptidase YafK
MKKYVLMLLVLFPVINTGAQKADLVIVHKSAAKLTLKQGNQVVKEYAVVFGAQPVGHKQQAGDERTPEGRYLLDYKNEKSAFYKAIHISYPNEADIKRARSLGVDPGGDIMIHGQKNGFGWLAFIMQWFNWTDGCIAVKNSEMDEIWQAVDAGTPIDILP